MTSCHPIFILRDYFQNWHKRPLKLKVGLIRVWRSMVKVTFLFYHPSAFKTQFVFCRGMRAIAESHHSVTAYVSNIPLLLETTMVDTIERCVQTQLVLGSLFDLVSIVKTFLCAEADNLRAVLPVQLQSAAVFDPNSSFLPLVMVFRSGTWTATTTIASCGSTGRCRTS